MCGHVLAHLAELKMTNLSGNAIQSLLRKSLTLSGRTVDEIAAGSGLADGNTLTLILEGKAKLRFSYIPALAAALRIDAAHLLRMALEEYLPSGWPVIESVFAQGTLTANEKLLLERYRAAVGVHDHQACVLNGDRVVAVVTV
jgi:hypothetical protein